MFVSCTVFVLSGRGLCDGPIPRREESYRILCVFECDQVKIKTLYTCCEQVGRRGKDYETKQSPGAAPLHPYTYPVPSGMHRPMLCPGHNFSQFAIYNQHSVYFFSKL
jgi:hypothetical protein